MEHLAPDPTSLRVLQLVPRLRGPQTASTSPFSDLTTGLEGGHPVLENFLRCLFFGGNRLVECPRQPLTI